MDACCMFCVFVIGTPRLVTKVTRLNNLISATFYKNHLQREFDVSRTNTFCFREYRLLEVLIHCICSDFEIIITSVFALFHYIEKSSFNCHVIIDFIRNLNRIENVCLKNVGLFFMENKYQFSGIYILHSL